MKQAIVHILLLCAAVVRGEAKLIVTDAGPSAHRGHIEILGVAAGVFDPQAWQAGTLHLLPDSRHPLLEPREGKFRNIYAPSVVQVGDRWFVYYGGWDGEAVGQDHIYLAETRDFAAIADRRTVIDPGAFHHVCNVNVTAAPGGYAMMCTAWPDAQDRNKPVTFFSPDGVHWNGAKGEFAAAREQIIGMQGYDGWTDADVNGMNVLLVEEGKYRVYFSNFRDFGKTWRASGRDGKRFEFEEATLQAPLAVNDVKKFRVGEENWYLMGLHMNGPQLSYTLSRDGLKFPPPRELMRHRDETDRYMVALGWVVSGAQEEPGRRVLGLLYGAGAVASLDRNRIFATWLQKKAIVRDGEKLLAPSVAAGPDAQLVPAAGPLAGRMQLFAEDGTSLLGTSGEVRLAPGRIYSLGLSSR